MSLKCLSCGNELSQQVKFCPRCGVLVSQVQSPNTNVENTEPLVAEQGATAQQGTEALVPDTEELPVTSVSTNKISQPATAALKSQKEVVVATTAAIQPKPSSPRKLAAFASLFLLAAVAAVSIYFSAGKSSVTTADPVSTPNTILQPTPTEIQQPVNAATSTEAQTSPPETAEKDAEIVGEKQKSMSVSAGAGGAGPASTGKRAVPSTGSAEDHIKLGMNAGSPSGALAEYQKAQQLDPANMDVHYLMGSVYQQMGQLDQALAAHRKCTSGKYASVAAGNVKNLEKKLNKLKY